MKKFFQLAGLLTVLLGTMGVSRTAAQDPILTPIIINEVAPAVVNTVAPIVVNAVKPKPKANGLAKFEGTVVHANRAQVTVRALGDDMSIRTFALSPAAADKMQQVVDKGGYQYGDKITVEYDPQSLAVVKFKGKPSKPL